MITTKTVGPLLIVGIVALASGCGSSTSSTTKTPQTHGESTTAQHLEAPAAQKSHTDPSDPAGANVAGTGASHTEKYDPEKLASEARTERSGKAAQEEKENQAEQENGWEWSQIKQLQSFIERLFIHTKTSEDYCIALYIADHFTFKQYHAADESQSAEALLAARRTCVGTVSYNNPDNVEIY